ncbi:MAG TPA: hypothetical protein VFM46_00370, partial [Pseudomonadales bacterium]|nr:hypothetical protein [Pseudomonadales bacterium]
QSHSVSGNGILEESGKPYVVVEDDIKTLYFNAYHVQSEMDLLAPNKLALGYTQAMMGVLLLLDQPQEILIIGLGGGSLSKFCYEYFSGATVTTVEINPDVIALRNEFFIPADNERFRIVQADGAEYVQNKSGIADLIFLDAYDEFGIPAALTTPAFYRNCRNALRHDGVLVSNFNCNDVDLEHYMERLAQVFYGKVMEADAATSYNQIMFALKDAKLLSFKSLQEKSRQLQAQLKFDFPRYLKQMWESGKKRPELLVWLQD